MDELLQETILLDYKSKNIQRLIDEKSWSGLNDKDKILSTYNFVRDEIAFGYNIDDNIPASQVLSDGIGQCNTKGILFMALLRALGIPCRIHGFTIYKPLQKGAMKGFVYLLAPKEIIHSWVEVYYNNEWLNLEGFILDIAYLNKLQKKFPECEGTFCGYGVSTNDFKNPPISWNGGNTYIQNEGIARDFGTFNSPDDFFAKHTQALKPIKKIMYQKVGRHLMNRNIKKTRNNNQVQISFAIVSY